MARTDSEGVYFIDALGPEVTAAFSGRNFPESKRGNFFDKAGLDRERFVRVKQVHGAEVVTVRQGKIPPPDFEADGLVTDISGTVLGILTADCIPAFFWDPVRKVIGLTHAGWKGLKAKILTRTLEVMETEYGSRPADVRVAFGPAIHSCCYEVGPEFQEYFPGHGAAERQGRPSAQPIRLRYLHGLQQRPLLFGPPGCGHRANPLHHSLPQTALTSLFPISRVVL
jgi:YfiH family protein